MTLPRRLQPAAQTRAAFKGLSFTDDVIDWLTSEITENRDRKLVKSKVCRRVCGVHMAFWSVVPIYLRGSSIIKCACF